MSEHVFQFTIDGKQCVKMLHGTFNECRKQGNQLATGMGRNIALLCYNDVHRNWDFIGEFLGYMRFRDANLGEWKIKEDYLGLEK